MQVTELRVNNIVIQDGTHNINPPLAFINHGQEWSYISAYGIYQLSLGRIKVDPVPLTEDWCKKQEYDFDHYKEVIKLTAELWNKIIALPAIHPMDNQEHCRDIHNIQNRIFARSQITIKANAGI